MALWYNITAGTAIRSGLVGLYEITTFELFVATVMGPTVAA
jgi:hypothetical protein